jgi:hypothetical protein
MREGEALRVAIDLLHVPSRARALRTEPLPQGVPLLLQIAADDHEAVGRAVEITDRSRKELQDAAAFFIEQVLLWREADSYRVLGASPEASPGELRSNMANLVKWLHPDSDRQGQQSVFVNRVTMAWDDLKTPERRAAYDRRRARDEVRSEHRHDGRRSGRAARSSFQIDRYGPSRGGILRALRHLLRGTTR